MILAAGKWRRFFNLLIDYTAMMILIIAIVIVIGMVFGEDGIAMVELMPDILLGVAITLIYYLPFEYFSGYTLGKLITGTRVVTGDGRGPSFGQVLGRSFTRLVPFEAFSFFGQQGRGWHDRWPQTYVVRNR